MISFSKCTYIIYTHVCKKNMFHTFQRAEPEKSPEYKKWFEAHIAAINKEQAYDILASDVMYDSIKVLNQKSRRFKNQIRDLREREQPIDTSSCNDIEKKIKSWLTYKGKYTEQNMKKGARKKFLKSKTETLKDSLTIISGMNQDIHILYDKHGLNIDIKNALVNLLEIYRTTAVDLTRLRDAFDEIKKFKDNVAELKDKVVELKAIKDAQ